MEADSRAKLIERWRYDAGGTRHAAGMTGLRSVMTRPVGGTGLKIGFVPRFFYDADDSKQLLTPVFSGLVHFGREIWA
jgi:hypothetical protein